MIWNKFIDYLPKVLNVINILVLSSCVATTSTAIKGSKTFLIHYALILSQIKVGRLANTLTICNDNPIYA